MGPWNLDSYMDGLWDAWAIFSLEEGYPVGLPSKGVSLNQREKIISGGAVSDEAKNSNRNLLVVSGGEGHVDFRLGERAVLL